MMIHLLAGFMDYCVVFGCLALISSWIAFFYHAFYRLVLILKHFQSISIIYYRKSLRQIQRIRILMSKQELHYIGLLIFIIWLNSKRQINEIWNIFMDFANLLNLSRLFNEIKEVYSGIIFAQLVCGTWFIAASLFQMDMVKINK